jgi:ABC-type uncharacterized transport system substrate-binding protein
MKVEDGSLVRRLAVYVHRLIKGELTGKLPIEQMARSELSINTGAAQALRIEIPSALLAQADRVIERSRPF